MKPHRVNRPGERTPVISQNQQAPPRPTEPLSMINGTLCEPRCVYVESDARVYLHDDTQGVYAPELGRNNR